MKTKVLSILAVLMLIIMTSYAENPESSMQLQIRKQVGFPSSIAEKQIQGAVFVEFTLNEDGKVEVLNCNSLEGELQTYVYKKFAEITVKPDPGLAGKTFLMRFDFKLI